MYLSHLPKHGDGRMKHIQTFRASCSVADKSIAWLATEYTPNVHPVVVKLQEVSRLSEKEAQIAALLSKYDPPNVVYPICEFKCKNDAIDWKQPITTPKQFCSGYTDMTSVFVMEYIPFNLIDYLTTNDVAPAVMTSILKQFGFALLNLYVNLKMTHGDIGSGNIMLDISQPRTLSYTINGQTHTVDTLGYEPILIDFQRSQRYRGPPDAIVVADEISTTYDIISRWVKASPIRLTPYIDRLGNVSTVSDVVDILEEIGG
jgi:hypothetical protein